MRWSGRLLAATAALAAAAFLLPATQTQASEVACRDLALPVTLLGLPQTMHGRLCVPSGADTVVVLVPGGTYNSTYWDSPYDGGSRSFSRAVNRGGHATLTVDRLGTGRSSKPLSATVTVVGQAHAVHEVVQLMRAGTHGPAFDKVVVGGHSLGSAVALLEAGTYRDVDGVLVTGMAHRLNLVGALPIFTSLIPAALDPKFDALGLDGYLTTQTGARYLPFHRPGPRNEQLLALEETTKDVIAPGEVLDGALIGAVLPVSRLVDVPVLVVLGDDPAFCGLLATNCASGEALRRSEALFYGPGAELRAHVLHGYGHAINYSPDAEEYQRVVLDWLGSKIA